MDAYKDYNNDKKKRKDMADGFHDTVSGVLIGHPSRCKDDRQIYGISPMVKMF